MKQVFKRTLNAIGLIGVLSSIGCMNMGGGEKYRNLVDPCQFERYSSTARQETIASFTPQVLNGHVLDQTIWNEQFVRGTDQLTVGGIEKLDQLLRRRPEPDPRIFLATAHDIPYDAKASDNFAQTQQELNGRRVAAIQKYVTAATAGRPLPFEVLVHDPSNPAIAGAAISRSIFIQRFMYSGTLGIGGQQGGGVGGGIGGGMGGGQFGGGMGGGQFGGGMGGGQFGGGMGGGQFGGGGNTGSGTGSGQQGGSGGLQLR